MSRYGRCGYHYTWSVYLFAKRSLEPPLVASHLPFRTTANASPSSFPGCYAWPRDTRKQQATFEKLKEAYVKARYSALPDQR
jgi:hypothetical protein